MKITVFNGSPKGVCSNTNIIAQAFLDGAASTGAAVENVFLIGQDIQHCSGCFSCWFKTPGKCVHTDDMLALLASYRTSDVVCFATPVYLWNMTACMKNFLDRLIPLKSPTVVSTHDEYDMQNSGKMPDVVIISNAGFPGDNNFETMHQVMKTAEPILEIYRNCGMLLQSKNEQVRTKVAAYLDVVRQAGAAIANRHAVSDALRDSLNMPLMYTEEYIQYISRGI